eukprot:TRINITY_DN8130_c0_g1_i2.p1 TRINITY_DN8130_c0_g1~~TRINITY_DN8130_c0_g1_i2.p1  ORF type:complete len:1023 (+),score=166.31 TRINITY_DN8130_c0_g1_i2:81-3071(+)
MKGNPDFAIIETTTEEQRDWVLRLGNELCLRTYPHSALNVVVGTKVNRYGRAEGATATRRTVEELRSIAREKQRDREQNLPFNLAQLGKRFVMKQDHTTLYKMLEKEQIIPSITKRYLEAVTTAPKIKEKKETPKREKTRKIISWGPVFQFKYDSKCRIETFESCYSEESFPIDATGVRLSRFGETQKKTIDNEFHATISLQNLLKQVFGNGSGRLPTQYNPEDFTRYKDFPSRPPPTHDEADADRRNAVAIRSRFQHIRSVSNTLELSKKIMKLVRKIKQDSYIGLQSYRQAFQALSRISRGSSISALYATMRRDGVIPDVEIYNLILSVWCKRSVEICLFYITEMVDLRMGLHVKTLNAILHAVTWCRDTSEDESAKRARMSRIQECFAIGYGVVSFTEESYTPLIEFATSFEEGMKVFAAMLSDNNVQITLKSINALLRLCVTSNEPLKSNELFQSLEEFNLTPGPSQWRLLLQSQELSGLYPEVLKTWNTMIASNVTPTSQACDILLRTYSELLKHNDGTPFLNATRIVTIEKWFTLFITEYKHKGATNLWNSMLEIYTMKNMIVKGTVHLARMKKAGLPANSRTRALYLALTGEVMTTHDAIGSIDDDKTLAKYLREKYKLPSNNAGHQLRKKPTAASRYRKNVLADLEAYSVHHGPATTTTCVTLLGNSGGFSQAEDLYNQGMEAHDDMLPEELGDLCSAMMSVNVLRKDINAIQKISRDCVKKGGKLTPLMTTNLLWGLAKADTPLTVMLNTYENLKNSLQKGEQVPTSAGVALLSSCAGYDKAMELFESLKNDMEVSLPMIGCVLKPCGKEKSVANARKIMDMIATHGFTPRDREYVQMLNVCKEAGDVESFLETRDGEDLAKHNVQIDPSMTNTMLVFTCINSPYPVRSLHHLCSALEALSPPDFTPSLLSALSRLVASLPRPLLEEQYVFLSTCERVLISGYGERGPCDEAGNEAGNEEIGFVEVKKPMRKAKKRKKIARKTYSLF